MKQKTSPFTSAKEVDKLITHYFTSIKCEPRPDQTEAKPGKKPVNNTEQKAGTPEAEPATIAGLALHLGFNSRQDFEDYEANGKYAAKLKRARLRIEAGYEKKLHKPSPTGAIFALKSMSSKDRGNRKPKVKAISTVFKVEIVQSGPQLASSESEVVL